MDLLSLIGTLTKRRGDLFSFAESLAKRAKSVENLESMMLKDSKLIVRSLRDKGIKWGEFVRTVVERTLESNLAAVFIGAKSAKPRMKMEKAWPILIGNFLPHLIRFLDATKARLDKGISPQNFDFDETDEDYADGDEDLVQGIGATWKGIYSRVTRYLASPVYSSYALGEYLVKEEQGYKEMKRTAKKDKKTCEDCRIMEKQGWQPLGSLPMPGQQCRCFDRCRCLIEYR